MTRLSDRRERIVRVRALEHRLAAVRQTAAEKRIMDLLGVARRLGDLRANLINSVGPTSGASLQAVSELQGRLGRAESELSQPIKMAELHAEEATSARLRARSREDGAQRLRERDAAKEGYAQAIRADANRPFRRSLGLRK